MSINQLAFLLLVGLSVILYYLIPKKCQWGYLLLVSLFFYWLMGVHNFIYVIITCLSLTWGTLQIFRHSQALEKELKEKKAELSREERKEKKEKTKKICRRWLTGIIVLNLGILLILKYDDFLIDNLNRGLSLLGIRNRNHLGFIAPLGISYYTLQAIGYALEVYKGKAQPEKNPLKVLLYVTYYLQMTQGPIGRYPQMAPQLFGGHSFSFDNLAMGSRRILWGLFKKAVIADNLKPLVDSIFQNYDQVSGFTLFMGCIYMVLQMYADFSGYSDLVCGISKLYGIDIMENFKRPLFSQSLGEYWRRWHISLSSWFRDYVFYPASLSKGALWFGRVGKRFFSPRIKKIFPVVYAMAIVWFCTGLWHDASWRYILWGVANGVILIGGVVLEPWLNKTKEALHIREESKIWKGFCIVRTFLIVALLKVFPGAGSTSESLVIIKRILFHFSPEFTYSALFMDADWYRLVFALIGLCILLIVSIVQETREDAGAYLERKPLVLRWCAYLLVLGLLVYTGNFDVKVTGGFEYAQF